MLYTFLVSRNATPKMNVDKNLSRSLTHKETSMEIPGFQLTQTKTKTKIKIRNRNSILMLMLMLMLRKPRQKR